MGMAPAGSAPVTETFDHTGGAQEFVVPAEVCEVTIVANGAEGGDAGGSITAGRGGRAAATIAVTPGETLFVYVGGTADGADGGFDGGGDGTVGFNGGTSSGGGSIGSVGALEGGGGGGGSGLGPTGTVFETGVWGNVPDSSSIDGLIEISYDAEAGTCPDEPAPEPPAAQPVATEPDFTG